MGRWGNLEGYGGAQPRRLGHTDDDAGETPAVHVMGLGVW